MLTLENLPDKMLQYRAEHDVTIKEMAKLCNVSTQTVYSVEHGLQTPGRLTFAKFKLVIEGKEGQ